MTNKNDEILKNQHDNGNGTGFDAEYFCDALPKEVQQSSNKIIQKFYNWAQANAISVLAFGTGCGAIEMAPLYTARYDISRYGVSHGPTPRQSTLFIVSGYASLKTIKRIVRSYEQMQNPKFVMGVCSCTINGGMYFDSYNTINRLDHYIPVDTYVTGCMPRPEALIAGFDRIKELIIAGKAEGANKYAKEFEWYKANQKKIIKDWNMPEYNW